MADIEAVLNLVGEKCKKALQDMDIGGCRDHARDRLLDKEKGWVAIDAKEVPELAEFAGPDGKIRVGDIVFCKRSMEKAKEAEAQRLAERRMRDEAPKNIMRTACAWHRDCKPILANQPLPGEDMKKYQED